MANDGEVLYELGVDLDSNLYFNNGDINLVKYDDNLVQAVINRLNTELDELDMFYENYGSVLRGFFGWKATQTTLTFMKAEIENVLKEDDRLTAWETELQYIGNGVVRIDLILDPNPDYNIEVSLNLTDEGIILEDEDEEE